MEHSLLESWLQTSPDTLAMHMKTPEIDLETYRRINRIELAHSVLRKQRIYLDTMVWIRFRDAVLGRPTDPSFVKLHEVLKAGCRADRLICPLSYSSVGELLNQDDDETRRATARVMDELSGAVCIQPPHHLLGAEIECFLYSNLPLIKGSFDPADFAWTKVAHWVGQPTLSVDALTPGQLLAMQKTIDDTLSSLSTEALANQLPSEKRRKWFKKSSEETVEKLNDEKVKPANLHENYEKYLESEVWGGLDGSLPELGEVISRFAAATGHNGQASEEDIAAAVDLLRGLIGHAYRAGRIRNELPQIHISASLHAAVRYDQKRKYKPTDLEDFRHAGSALPYCQVFVTEKSLAHLLRHPPTSLIEDYTCAVFSDCAEATEHIRALVT